MNVWRTKLPVILCIDQHTYVQVSAAKFAMDAESVLTASTVKALPPEKPPRQSASRVARPWSARTQGSTLSKYGVNVTGCAAAVRVGECVPTAAAPVDAATQKQPRADDTWRPESVVKKWQEAVCAGRSSNEGRPLTSRSVSELMRNYLMRKEKPQQPFTTVFHSKSNLDLRFEQFSRLSISASERQAKQQHLVVNGTTAQIVAKRDGNESKRRASPMRFCTSWRTPRNFDLRDEAIKSLSLGTHAEPYVPLADRCRLRATDDEQAEVFRQAQESADLHSARRPPTPRSVSSFFGNDAEFLRQDEDFANRLKSKILKVSACTVASRPSSAAASRMAATPCAAPASTPSPPAAAVPLVIPRRPQSARQARRGPTDSCRAHFVDDPRDVAAWVQRVRAASAADDRQLGM